MSRVGSMAVELELLGSRQARTTYVDGCSKEDHVSS
jgi:hypothetical protein